MPSHTHTSIRRRVKSLPLFHRPTRPWTQPSKSKTVVVDRDLILTERLLEHLSGLAGVEDDDGDDAPKDSVPLRRRISGRTMRMLRKFPPLLMPERAWTREVPVGLRFEMMETGEGGTGEGEEEEEEEGGRGGKGQSERGSRVTDLTDTDDEEWEEMDEEIVVDVLW